MAIAKIVSVNLLPPPAAEEIYKNILALEKEGVWVPAVSNGGLRLLLKELERRGWRIYPPAEEER